MAFLALTPLSCCIRRLVAAGSDDMSTRIYPIQDMANFGVTSLGGHNAAVLAVFFERDSLDCYTLSRWAPNSWWGMSDKYFLSVTVPVAVVVVVVVVVGLTSAVCRLMVADVHVV